MAKQRTSKRKTSRRTKPVRRSAAARRTSRRMRANTIPPPPQLAADLEQWARKTYAANTSVRLLVPWHFERDDGYGRVLPRTFPAGTRARIHGPTKKWLIVRVDVDVPLFTSSVSEQWVAPVRYEDLARVLQPLDDNWGPLVVAPKRSSPKPQPGWQKQLSASRSLRARKMQPNAKCPSCGSPHYFEGMFDRDCATPTCRYYRGGTIGSTGDAEPTASSPKRTGSRRLAVTSETVHASEPDVYPEIDNESEEDIVIEADDLDDDETFAERAAKVIADELGYVEGSEMGAGAAPRWYTQSDSDEDYSTGDSTRRSIHIDNGEWTAEERREIYDTLKRRKLVS